MPDNDLIRLFNQLFVNEQIPELIDLVNANPETFFGEGLPPLVDNVVKSLEAQELVTRPTAEVISSLPELGDITLGGDTRSSDRDLTGLSTSTPGLASTPRQLGEMSRMFDFGQGTFPSNELYAAGPGKRMSPDMGHTRYSDRDLQGARETTRGLYPGGGETSNPWKPTTQAEQSFRENVLGDRGVLYGGITPRLQGGGYVGRGTVAGELGRRGDMSVREEGETMAELSKRHREQDWYSKDKMGGGLGSLGPLRRDRRRA